MFQGISARVDDARPDLCVSDDLDRRCQNSLHVIMEQLADQIGADGAVLTEHEDAGVKPLVIFADTPFEGAVSAEEAMLIERGSAPGSAGRPLAGSGSVTWRTTTMADEDWSVMDVPIPSGDHRRFKLTAYFKGAGLQVRSAAERTLKPFQPLLSGFLGLWTMRSALRERLDGMACALNSAAVGIVLLDRQSRIVFANKTAARLMEASDGIRRMGSNVAATQLSDSVRLQVAIEHVIAGEAVADASRATVPVVSLRRSSGLRPVMVSVLAPENLRGRRREVCAILYLFDPDEDVAPLIKPVCKLYGLSPAETRVACALTSGVSLAEAAAALKIKEQTARTYLKQIFLKTDTKRQADLVRLMLTSIVRTDRDANLEII